MDHRMEVCEMKISTAFLSEIGGRERNEDTVCIRQKERNLCVFVGDGLGGYDGGKIASVAAAEAVMKHWESRGLWQKRICGRQQPPLMKRCRESRHP